jgi:hypothetical protein
MCAPWRYNCGRGGTAPLILNFGTAWRWWLALRSGSCTAAGSASIYLQARTPGWPQKRSRRFRIKRNFLPLLGIGPRFVGCPVHGLAIIRSTTVVFLPWTRRYQFFVFSETSVTKDDTAWHSDQEDHCVSECVCVTLGKNGVCSAGSICIMNEMLRTSVILLYDVGLCSV